MLKLLLRFRFPEFIISQSRFFKRHLMADLAGMGQPSV